MDTPVYAGFGRRLAATLVDLTLISVVVFPLLYLFYGPDYFLWAETHNVFFNIYSFGDFMISKLMPLAFVVYCWHRYGATPGKFLLGCRVIDLASGKHPELGQAVGRYLAYVVSLLPAYLGFLWILWDRRKQGFHDKLVKTAVLYEPDDESTKSLQQLMREAGV